MFDLDRTVSWLAGRQRTPFLRSSSARSRRTPHGAVSAARKVGHTAIYSGARRQMMHVVWKRKGVAYYVGLAKTLLEAWAE